MIIYTQLFCKILSKTLFIGMFKKYFIMSISIKIMHDNPKDFLLKGDNELRTGVSSQLFARIIRPILFIDVFIHISPAGPELEMCTKTVSQGGRWICAFTTQLGYYMIWLANTQRLCHPGIYKSKNVKVRCQILSRKIDLMHEFSVVGCGLPVHMGRQHRKVLASIYDVGDQRSPRPACASALSDQGIRLSLFSC